MRGRRSLPSFAAAVALLLAALAPVATHARIARAMIACSLYVSPCHCGLCPNIVDCAKLASAECFCGSARPGIYAHPSDTSKFWMCSYNTQAQLSYGVEVSCPARLVFDPLVKVCTVPVAISSPLSPAGPSTPSTPSTLSRTAQPVDAAAAGGSTKGGAGGSSKASIDSSSSKGATEGSSSRASEGVKAVKAAVGTGTAAPGLSLSKTVVVGSSQVGGVAYAMNLKGAVTASSSSSSKKP